jgi:hypothetical protein
LEGKWPKIAILVFVGELALLFFDASVPLPARIARLISSQNNQIGQTASSLDLLGKIIYIFSNNFNIASFEFVPLYGWLTFNNSMMATARSIAAIGILSNATGAEIVLSLLFQPHTWLELPSYAIALTQSFFLIVALFRRKLTQEVIRTLLVWLIVALELLIAATFEASEITEASVVGNPAWIVSWLAFAGLATVVLYFRGIFLRKYHSKHPKQVLGYPLSSSVEDRPRLYDTITVLPPTQTEDVNYCPQCGSKVASPASAFYCEACGMKL